MGNTSSFYKATSGGWLEESLRVSNLETMTVELNYLWLKRRTVPQEQAAGMALAVVFISLFAKLNGQR